MKTMRRIYIPSLPYFITGVTHRRRPILLEHVETFWSSWAESRPDAWVILPDHFHAIVKPDPYTISDLVFRFKLRFCRRVERQLGTRKVWQNRFWDHAIRDERDWLRHLAYVHYNPVHHELLSDPMAYEHSSIAKWSGNGRARKDIQSNLVGTDNNRFGE
jgi:putative transposase